MTKQERFRKFSCHLSLDTAIRVADAAQTTPHRMVVVSASGKYFVVFNWNVVSKAYDELKALPIVYEASR